MSKLILGTVQMGLPYGINNTVGKLTIDQSHLILLKAYSSGITTLDTAEAYGDAHKIIGEFHRRYRVKEFKIVTKVPHNINVTKLKSKIFEYLKDLRINCLDVLMFHSFDSFVKNSSSIKELIELKNNGFINKIGVSVYTNEQLEYLLDHDEITVVQLPFNLLDNESLRGKPISELKKRGKEIHSRSAFLQGLFFMDLNSENKVIKGLKSEIEKLHEIRRELGCTMQELALGYCNIQNNIDKIIIGVDSINHLEENLAASLFELEEIRKREINNIRINDIDLLNPSLW